MEERGWKQRIKAVLPVGGPNKRMNFETTKKECTDVKIWGNINSDINYIMLRPTDIYQIYI